MKGKFKVPPLVNYDGILSKEERKRILARIHSLLYWVGHPIPDEEIIGKKRVRIRDIVFNLVVKDKLTDEDVENAQLLVKELEKKEKSLEAVIAHGNISEEDAIRLLDEACGLLRAIDNLRNIKSLRRAQLEKEMLMRKVEDEKRWRDFIKAVRPEGKVTR